MSTLLRASLLALIVWLGLSGHVGADDLPSEAGPVGKVVYKKIGETRLRLWFYDSTKPAADTARAAVIFFHGGGWRKGSPKQFSGQARHLAGLGMVAVSAEYRLFGTHGTGQLEAVLDAKSAIRWLRANAARFQIDPNRIAAAGGSAGGHLALSAAIVDDLNDPSDDLSVRALPDALMLFNPVVSLRMKGLEKVSPLHRLSGPLPPTIILHGTDDTTAPYATVQEFAARARSTGSTDITVVAYEGRTHGFFNRKGPGSDDYAGTLAETVRFLERLGWIKR